MTPAMVDQGSVPPCELWAVGASERAVPSGTVMETPRSFLVARSNACTNSLQLGKRLVGSLDIARRTTSFCFRHGFQVGRRVEVVVHHFGQADTGEHAPIQAQLGVGERQSVLIAVLAEFARPDFR